MQTIRVSAKCADLCTITGMIDDMQIFYDDYVPKFLGPFGDYVELEINTDTMEIISLGPCEVVNGKLTGISKEDIIKSLNRG